MSKTIQEISTYFSPVQWKGNNGFQCNCPVHSDKKPSLTVTQADNKILFHCHAGCDTADILEAVGLKWSDVMPEQSKNLPPWKRGLIDEYRYTDENGKYLYSKLRYTDKDGGKIIRYARTHGDEYQKGKGEVSGTLYRLPELLQAISEGKPVYYVEGEKDVESLRWLGLTATTAGAVKDWKRHFSKYFEGAEVIILPDNDDPGRDLANRVQKDIRKVCKRSKQVVTSEEDKGDVTDWLKEKHSGGIKDKKELVKILEEKCRAVPWIRKTKNNLLEMKRVQEQKIEWLEYKFIPKNEVSIFAGDGGSGKSSFIYGLIADLSQGRKTIFGSTYPQEERIAGFVRTPKKCAIFTAEDSIPKIILPKLKRYGANLDNIYGIGVGNEGFDEMKLGSEELMEVLKEYRPDVAVFDPLQSFLESSVDMSRRNQMRNSLNPLKNLAEEYGLTSLIILHTNKKTGVWGRNRIADSADVWDIARSVFVFGETKTTDSVLGNRYISNEKNSYAERQDTLLFNIENGLAVGKSWTEKRDFDFVMERRFSDERGNRLSPTLEDAKEYIVSVLKENGGSMLTNELKEYIANTIPFSGATLNRAKADLKKAGVIGYEKEGGRGDWKTVLFKDFMGGENS